MATEFGATAWGRVWLKTVEVPNVAVPNPLLPKARSLVRNNAVAALTVEAGRLRGSVVVRGVSHRVHIQWPPWDGPTRRQVTRLVGAARTAHPGLAAGDLPDDLANDLRRQGIAIASPAEERMIECTCPARRSPCVHALAALYALIQRIDEQPALVIELRGAEPTPATPSRHPDWIELSELSASGFYGPDPGR